MRVSFISMCTLAAACAVGCSIESAPRGLRATPLGDGPQVVFDLSRRPLPEIPQPNDVATFPDPTSRTGKRLNVSLLAPTLLEREAREGFNSMEGWGTFAPITVAFARGPGTPPTEAAIDLDSVAARMVGDAYNFADDAVYLVNLKTGVPVPLDMGNGNFPSSVVDKSLYFRNDAKAAEENLLFETTEEGAGLDPSAYTPALDQDFDGILDHPNTRPLNTSSAQSSFLPKIDDLLTWYERESDTLLLRPVIPLDEKTEYAVLLTDRLRNSLGQPVRSPFPFVHHPDQASAAARVRDIIAGGATGAYFGDLSGTGLDHIAFIWSFTTQPTVEDLRILRDGLHGSGPFAKLATDFPPTAKALQAIGLSSDPAADQLLNDPKCAAMKNTPFIVRPEVAGEALKEVGNQVLGLSDIEAESLRESLDNVDYFVVGQFDSPYFMGDPEHEDPRERFRLNYLTGEGPVSKDTVYFFLSVPKATASHRAPFPATVWGHGTGLFSAEILVRAGYFAKQGIAIMGIDLPGHGLVLDAGTTKLAEILFRPTCMLPFVSALSKGRARDLNGDGIPDSGGHLWTGHAFHSRDNIRQSIVDEMQTTRILRSWDSFTRSEQDYNNDGNVDLAGDFNGDGVPDVGGPSVPLFTSGNSFGGITAMVHGAVDSEITASAPISGGGGLSDIAVRSNTTPSPVLGQILTPLLTASPASDFPAIDDVPKTQCSGDQRSVRFIVNDLIDMRELEVACVSAGELAPDFTVVVTNVATDEKRCSRVDSSSRVRLPIPASKGDRLDIQIYNSKDAVTGYKGCAVRPEAPVGRRISTWEQKALSFSPMADYKVTCESTRIADDYDEGGGCQQFQGRFYPVGSPLVAPQEGLGLLRQSPEVRRLVSLTQAALDPADPVSFAPYYMLKTLPNVDGTPLPPRAIVTFNTVGDPLVPTGTGNAFARASGALPFFPPRFRTSFPEYGDYMTPEELFDSLSGKTPNEVLIQNGVVEGLARLSRTHAGPACQANYMPSNVCVDPPDMNTACAHALYDADWLAEGADRYDAPHPTVPLRLARIANVHAVDTASATRAWSPRLLGVPGARSDDGAWAADSRIVGLVNAYNRPEGIHVWVQSEPCKAFDDALYYDHLLIRFFASGGKDLYSLSHPHTHTCLENESCPFFPQLTQP